jgi:hypothetical protein
MPIEFKLEQRLAGFTATSARKDEKVAVVSRELLGPQDPELADRLDKLQGCLFSKIPNLPAPPRIGDLFVIVNRDLTGIAYVDELSLTATIKAARPVEKGQAVFIKDISNVEAVHLDTAVPDDAAIVVVRSTGWKRSLFFVIGPQQEDSGNRTYDLDKALGQQMTLLFGLPAPTAEISTGQARLEGMKQSLDRLVDLLADQCDDEDTYQELLTSAHGFWVPPIAR